MLTIRLRRMGTRHKPFYRLVVSDSRNVPTGAAVEEVGHYDPRQSPPLIRLDQERIDHWVSRGAKLSNTVASLLRRGRTSEDEASAESA